LEKNARRIAVGWDFEKKTTPNSCHTKSANGKHARSKLVLDVGDGLRVDQVVGEPVDTGRRIGGEGIHSGTG